MLTQSDKDRVAMATAAALNADFPAIDQRDKLETVYQIAEVANTRLNTIPADDAGLLKLIRGMRPYQRLTGRAIETGSVYGSVADRDQSLYDPRVRAQLTEELSKLQIPSVPGATAAFGGKQAMILLAGAALGYVAMKKKPAGAFVGAAAAYGLSKFI